MIEEKLDKKFINIVNEIKNEIKTTQIKVTIETNKNFFVSFEVTFYYFILI